MKIVNTTAIAPVLDTALEKYNAPDWLVYLLGSIILVVFAYAIFCKKFSEGSTACYTGCSVCCGACKGCLVTSSENCTYCRYRL